MPVPDFRKNFPSIPHNPLILTREKIRCPADTRRGRGTISYRNVGTRFLPYPDVGNPGRSPMIGKAIPDAPEGSF
ncbi:hypothetical protein Hsar01_01031 [Haloferula sargassicola]|uniref:Uncharacterized protein n=1 Tax=Haloferula sargassicola TaxID=490096 RepID=A0ABP9UJX2_9BACT